MFQFLFTFLRIRVSVIQYFYKCHEFSFTRVFVFLSFYYGRPSVKKNKETINICALWAINTNSALVNLLMKLLDFYHTNTSMLTVTSVNIYVRVRHLSRIWRSHVMYCKKSHSVKNYSIKGILLNYYPLTVSNCW